MNLIYTKDWIKLDPLIYPLYCIFCHCVLVSRTYSGDVSCDLKSSESSLSTLINTRNLFLCTCDFYWISLVECSLQCRKDTLFIINHFYIGYKIVDLTWVSRCPRLTLAVGYLTSQAAVKSVNRSQPPPRSKRCEGGAATHPPATWPGVTWTRPPKPQKNCTLNHFACKNNQVDL